MNRSDLPQRRYGSTPATAPGPSPASMIARIPAISTDPLTFLEGMRHEHGPVVQFPLPRPPTYFIDEPAAIRRVLIDGSGFDKDTPQYRALRLVTGPGLLAAIDEQWRTQRPVVQPAFHASAARGLAADTELATRRLTARWDRVPPGAPVDVEEAMAALALEAIVRHLFGGDLPGASASELADATLHALAAVVDSIRFPQSLLQRLPTPARRRHSAGMRALDDAVDELIARRASPGAASPPNLLDLLLAAYPDRPRAVRDQVVTFLVAGHETLATALTWTLGLLARHPAEQERVAAQVRGGGTQTHAVDAVLCEALRLYPPAWVITRSTRTATELGGRAIPAGALLIISPWVRHRDESIWPAAGTFDPGRFGDEPLAMARRLTVRGDYLPFGAGKRLCIGRDMALLQGREVIARLVSRYRFQPVQADLPPVEALVTLRPATGLRVRIRPRVP